MLVGHRGEKAFMPEHTLASYWQAALEKADYIEPDITLTKDGHLVVNHNEWLSENTNVASIPELAHLRTSKTWDDGSGPQNVTDEWFVVDMTLEQIKMLRVHQDPKYTWRPQHFNGMFGILTFEEYLQIVRNVTAELGRPYGVIPELKSPKLYNLGRSYPRYFEDRALLTLEHYGWAKLSDSVNRSAQADLQLADPLPLAPGVQLGPRAWQSFDLDTAEYLAQHSDVPVVALCQSLPWVFTPTGLDRVAKYASILSPWKDFFVAGAEPYFRANNITWDADEIKRMGGLIAAKDLAAEAHKRNLAISPYTFYDSHQRMGYLCQANTSEPDAGAAFCPKDRGEEFAHFFSLGVDYMFVENIVEASLLRAHYDDLLQAKNAA
ncbi:hypothetical protein LPJ61_006804 [Coemansia biformis]|uniref:glycerophosphodiester phosphodiesterase n=1 Tax=Coemansia biformis TaxID=1286918 RepID=A0A9W8CN42_9FUNG|nr:hypothetical protein LPJ61_006804 [Coemansia biformis]